MSSHHIVREDQEPALVLEDWHELGEQLLGQLLEWSPTVVASDSAAVEMTARQTKVDVVIGRAAATLVQDTVRFIHTEAPFADAAIRYLVAQGYTAAYLASTRMNPVSLLPYMPEITITLFSKGMRYYPVRPGFSKWKPAGETVYIQPVDGLRYTGLATVGDGTFRTTDDGFFTLSFPGDYLIIGEPFSTALHDDV